MITFPGAWVRDGSPIITGYWLVRERIRVREWGPPLPAAIMLMHTTAEPGEPDNRMERSPFLAAFVGGEPVSIWSLQQATHTFGERIYRREKEIDEAEYRYRIADLQHAQQWRPSSPLASPRKPLDLLTAEPPW